ncbi:MAG TPA: hypothetical protein VGM06_10910 [Polyangiaceae bacterium]|jgi:hypothetical protein
MRHRFANVLESDEKDPSAEIALRRFWARTAPSGSARRCSTEARVIDLAGWAQGREEPTRR